MSIPHECPPAGRRCFDCNPRAGIEHTGELPPWAAVRHGNRQFTEDAFRRGLATVSDNLTKMVDELIAMAPPTMTRAGRIAITRKSLSMVLSALDGLFSTLVRLHETDAHPDAAEAGDAWEHDEPPARCPTCGLAPCRPECPGPAYAIPPEEM